MGSKGERVTEGNGLPLEPASLDDIEKGEVKAFKPALQVQVMRYLLCIRTGEDTFDYRPISEGQYTDYARRAIVFERILFFDLTQVNSLCDAGSFCRYAALTPTRGRDVENKLSRLGRYIQDVEKIGGLPFEGSEDIIPPFSPRLRQTRFSRYSSK